MSFKLQIREKELNEVKKYFATGNKVLEIGGGNGYQASIIKSWVLEIKSIDVDLNHNEKYFEVEKYDGVNLPFSDESFDVIFSSNVLEHVRDLDLLIRETKRVIKPKGIIIHLIPSSTWRFWTILAHYPYLAIRLFNLILGKEKKIKNNSKKNFKPVSRLFNFLLKFFPQSHGEYSSAIKELYYFSKFYWKKKFLSYDFKIEKTADNQIFYTGYHLLKYHFEKTRFILSKIIGGSCNIFILKK
jgi:SAM-dependent methyltransferase